MPNWCSNQVIIKHDNVEAIKRVKDAFMKDKLCDEFIPVPAELRDAPSPNRTNNAPTLVKKYGYSDWYEFCVNNWGTKWDVGSGSGGHIHVSKSGKKITISFDSAWAPPTGLYKKLLEEGYDLTAYYFESGMMFAGKFTRDSDEEYEVVSSKQVKDELPSDLDEAMSISETLAGFEEMMADETDDTNGKDDVNNAG